MQSSNVAKKFLNFGDFILQNGNIVIKYSPFNFAFFFLVKYFALKTLIRPHSIQHVFYIVP